MRRIGGKRVSVKRMKESKEKRINWKLSSMYTATVAGVVTYFSLVLNLLGLIIQSEVVNKIIGAGLSITVLALLFAAERQYKKFDKINNESRFDDILQAISVSGIIGFVVDRLFIVPFSDYVKSYEYICGMTFILVILLMLPILCTIVIIRQKD